MRRLLAAVALGSSIAAAQTDVRPPAVAGDFYPADAAKLRAAIQTYLASARPAAGLSPVAIVVPHAGYVFSGQIAADAFKQTAAQTYDTVVILGTNHTDAGFDRIAAFRGAGFRTPLGTAEIDQGVLAALMQEDPDIVWNARAHAREHSVEVQVPFVQQLFPAARIVPLVVGAPDSMRCARLGRSLAGVLQGRRALIVASSDLSHYPAAADARRVDRETLDAIASLDAARVQSTLAHHLQRGVPQLVTGACGEGPILAAIAAARALGVSRGTVVSYANSGDSPAGDASRTVGYGAVVMAPGEPPRTAPDASAPDGSSKPDVVTPLTRADQKALLSYARETIRLVVTTGIAPLSRDVDPRLLREAGVFVTLKKRGDLRGCVGRITPNGPVHWLVGAMALHAAVNDPRFEPVRPDELAQLEVEVSLLTPPREIPTAQDIVIGRDGVILMKNGQSAVFLPEVAVEQGWTREALLDNLCQKAGLPGACWRSGARLATFQAQVFKESDLR
jgi:AmmeMemoRadiSam system protein B/AmmeMemoRadiSam system protein A